jgi:hypothetical protein
MDAFDQIPSRRSKKTAQRASPTKPLYTFASIDDTPEGVTFSRTPNGYKADAAARRPLIALLFGVALLGLGFLIFQNLHDERATMSFFVVLSVVASLCIVPFMFFILGREGIEVKGDLLYLRKSLFGISIPKSMILPDIIRAQVVKRSGTLGLTMIRPIAWDMGVGVSTGDQVLEVESDTHLKTMGSHLHVKHLYYMRHLIIEAVKASRNKSQETL